MGQGQQLERAWKRQGCAELFCDRICVKLFLIWLYCITMLWFDINGGQCHFHFFLLVSMALLPTSYLRLIMVHEWKLLLYECWIWDYLLMKSLMRKWWSEYLTVAGPSKSLKKSSVGHIKQKTKPDNSNRTNPSEALMCLCLPEVRCFSLLFPSSRFKVKYEFWQL